MKPKAPIPAQATVERVAGVVGGGPAYWQVRVHTAPWYLPPRQAYYLILADSDTIAAHEGLRRFEEEAAKPKLLVTP